MLNPTDCPYLDPIVAAMKAYLPMWSPMWGLAQLYQESLWKPDARSEAGAMGIAQFMPATWMDMVDEMGYIGPASPFDPIYAIPVYARYMRDLRSVWSRVDRTEDDRRRLTQASYNCGTGNMLKAQVAAHGATDYATIVAALHKITGEKNAMQTTDYVLKCAKWYGQLTST